MNNYIPKRVGEMKEYVPDTSCPKIKLDANESPYETPESVLKAINNALDFKALNRYPDPDMKELLASYGRYVGVTPDRLVAGDGSDELIALIINTFLCDGGKILICDPDFSMYTFYSEFSGCDIVKYSKPDGEPIDFSAITGLIERENVRLVIFSNPCNPTGEINVKEEILSFVDKVKAIVVCDEAYMEFAPVPQSVIMETEQRDNLVVLKTVSKIGLAGLRCGFAISNKALIAALKKTKSPYNLNSVTQKAVAVAMDNYEDIAANVEKIKAVTAQMYTELKPLEEKLGFKINRSNANFVFLRFTKDGEAKRLHSFLKENGISVRIAANTLRITAGTNEEAAELYKALRNYR